MDRSSFNKICGVVGAVLGFVCLVIALSSCASIASISRDTVGKVIVFFWVIVPPIFFWIDWVGFYGQIPAGDRDFVKHTHDLSRNIWLALVVLLSFLFNIKVGGG
jgi:hypothetical protein